jgi:hypothetical protein
MNDKEFKEHIKELAHGKHNVAEHDWETRTPTKKARATKPAKSRRKTRTA